MQTKFLQCAEKVKILGGNLDNADRLYFYSRYKQATSGNNNNEKPGLLDFEGRKKWEAWKSVENMSTEQAQDEYVNKFLECFPGIIIHDPIHPNIKNDDSLTTITINKDTDGNCAITNSKDDKTISLNCHSQPTFTIDFRTKLCKDSDSINLWMELAQEDNAEGMQVLLEDNPDLINSVDDDGMTALHWAVDRNSINVLNFLLKHLEKLDVNKQNSNLETALHLSNDVETWVLLIGKFKIDETIKDDTGAVAELIQ